MSIDIHEGHYGHDAAIAYKQTNTRDQFRAFLQPKYPELEDWFIFATWEALDALQWAQ